MIQDNDLKCQEYAGNPSDTAYSGQSTKHIFKIISPGFDMHNGDWDGLISVASGQTMTVNSSNTVWENDICYLCITSESTWVGNSTLLITARVPDQGFPNNTRIEKFKVHFVKYIKP